MNLSLVNGSSNEDSKDALSKLSSTGTRDEAKAATEKFLLDAKSKADAHFSESQQPKGSLEDIFQYLSEVSGLCAWHSRKLTRLLLLVRTDGCDIGMIQTLEEPLTDFFNDGFGDDFLVSVRDYKFYADIKLEESTEDSGIDSDLIRWAEHNAGIYVPFRHQRNAQDSFTPLSAVIEALGAVRDRLKEWKLCIQSMRTKENTFQKTKLKIFHFFGNEKRLSVDDRKKISLGASPEKFEILIDGMSTLIDEVKMKLPEFDDVTSRRHEHALTVLLDDIRLQIKQANGPELAIMERPDLTLYQRAQALEVRVKDWVRHELEFCEFRDEIERLVNKRS